MKNHIKLIGEENLDDLTSGLKNVPLSRATFTLTDYEYQKQASSISRRGTNASVVGIVFDCDRLAIVRRGGSHAGLALMSGSILPWNAEHPETFHAALHREAGEELGVELLPESVQLDELEERTFLHSETGAAQRIYVATLLAQTAVGHFVHQTETATEEGLEVMTFALSEIPHLAFRDDDKVTRVLAGLSLSTA